MLSLQNFQDHPTSRNKKVFYFKDHTHAAHFETMLVENKVDFERQIDEEGDQRIYYGVKTSDYKAVLKLNFLTLGAFRKPFIPDRFFRYFVIALSLFILGLAILGAIITNH